MKNTLLIAVALVASCLPFTLVNAKDGETKTTILENGQYFNGKTFVPFSEIVIKDGKIVSINSSKLQTVGKRISLAGMYLLPGLTDAHVHLGGSPSIPFEMVSPLENANSGLNCGVTMMVDLFYEESKCKELRHEAKAQPALYPSLYLSGPILTAPGGHGTEYGVPTRTITSVSEASKITGEVIDGGADVIKLAYEADSRNYIPSLTKEMVAAIVSEAHKRHKKVFAHIDLATQAADCAEVGVDVLAHMPEDSLTPGQLRQIKKSGMIIIPTLTVLESLFEGHDAGYMSDSLLWKTANSAYLEHFDRKAIPKPPTREKFSAVFRTHKYMQNLENCIKMHIPILAGTDAGNFAVFYGYSLHHELAQYVKAGMSDAEAICAATSNISLVFPEITTGKIKPGYDADLVVLREDPLKNIENTKTIDRVFHKGELAKLEHAGGAAEITPEKFVPAVFNLSGLSTLPPYIVTFADQSAGGKSHIVASIRKDGSAECLAVTGKVVKTGYFGYAGVQVILNGKTTPIRTDLGEYKSIEFETMGNGGKYYFSLVSDKVKDYNFHSATFNPGSDWQKVSISFDDLKQSPYYGKKIALDLKTISVVSFTASGGDQDIDFAVRNIHFLK